MVIFMSQKLAISPRVPLSGPRLASQPRALHCCKKNTGSMFFYFDLYEVSKIQSRDLFAGICRVADIHKIRSLPSI